jgi:hypothetical protein
MILRSLTEPGLQEVITILLAWLNSLLFAEDRYDKFIEILCFFYLYYSYDSLLSEESLCMSVGPKFEPGTHALGAGRLANN